MWVRRLGSSPSRFSSVLVVAAAVAAPRAPAQDWPQHLGPERDGVYRGADLAGRWSLAAKPKLLWEVKVGAGFAGPAVIAEKAILFHRRGDDEIVDCHEAGTGSKLWSFSYPTSYRDDFGFDAGPRSTPTVSSGKVFAYGAEGVLSCVDLANGRKLWLVAAQKELGAPKGFFGAGCSPLVVESRVLVNVGGKNGAGIVAFETTTGRVLWTSTEQEASYSSPALAKLGTAAHALFFTREGLVDLDPADGKVRFSFPWRPRMRSSVNAATPILSGDLVFISTSYGKGAAVLRVGEGPPEVVWSADGVLSSHYATSVLRDGRLYGFDGRQEQGASLRCVEITSGKVIWSKDGLGSGSVSLAGERLVLLLESGELALVAASPERYDEVARAKLFSGTVRAFPALANGRLFARDETVLRCYELRDAGR